MKQHNPNATPQQVKEQLKNGTDLWTDTEPNTYGAGYMNAEASIPAD
jgi:serine protease AprX